MHLNYEIASLIICFQISICDYKNAHQMQTFFPNGTDCFATFDSLSADLLKIESSA